ncbi:hypothetical protein D3C81_119670 [compost metagenome]
MAVERFAAHRVFAQAFEAVARQVDGATAVDPLRARQQFAHQPAARMGQQVQHGAMRQLAHQGQRVVDGTFAEAAVFVAIDAVAVLRRQARRQAIAPQAAKAARGRRRRAVQQQQHRFRPWGQAGHLRHGTLFDAAAVQAQTLLQLAVLEGAGRRQRRHGAGAATVHAQGPEHPGAQAVAAGTRGRAHALRPQGQSHFDGGRRAIAGGRGRPQVARQVERAGQQRAAVRQQQLHHVGRADVEGGAAAADAARARQHVGIAMPAGRDGTVAGAGERVARECQAQHGWRGRRKGNAGHAVGRVA